MPAYLIQKDDEESSAYPLDKPIVVIGRSDDCDIVIRRSMKLSRRHCCVAQVNGKLIIRDLGSMNGLKVNGDRTSEEELHEGDEILLGDLKFVFTLSSKPDATIKKSGHKHKSEKQSKPPKSIPAANLSLEFPQAVPEDEEDPLPTPVNSKSAKSSGKSSKKKAQSKQGGLLDSGDLDVGGLGLD